MKPCLDLFQILEQKNLHTYVTVLHMLTQLGTSCGYVTPILHIQSMTPNINKIHKAEQTTMRIHACFERA